METADAQRGDRSDRGQAEQDGPGKSNQNTEKFLHPNKLLHWQ